MHCAKKSKSLNITVLFLFHSVIEIIESLSVCTRGVAFTPTASLRLRLTRQLMASYNAEPTHGPLPLLQNWSNHPVLGLFNRVLALRGPGSLYARRFYNLKNTDIAVPWIITVRDAPDPFLPQKSNAPPISHAPHLLTIYLHRTYCIFNLGGHYRQQQLLD